MTPAKSNLALQDDQLPSTDRAPVLEEEHIATLTKSVAHLKKKILAEEKKLQKFRTEVTSLQSEMEKRSAPARQRALSTVTQLAKVVIAACEAEKFSPHNKMALRDLLFNAIEELGHPECAMPEWINLDPPEPDSLERLQQERATSGKGATDETRQKSFDFFEDDDEGESEDEDPFANYFEEFQRQQYEEQERTRRIFRGESSSVSDDEKRALRALYLKLVTAVHPDLVTDEKEREYRTQLAARINNAYKAGHLTVLLEIEEQLATKQQHEAKLARFQFFVDEIKHLEETQTLLLQQLSRVKGDMTLLKRSEFGQMHKELKRHFKNGGVREVLIMGEVRELCADYDRLIERVTKASSGAMKMKSFTTWLKTQFDFESGDDFYDEDTFCAMEEMFEELVREEMKHGGKKRR